MLISCFNPWSSLASPSRPHLEYRLTFEVKIRPGVLNYVSCLAQSSSGGSSDVRGGKKGGEGEMFAKNE
jgi:hypothetical protein